MQSRRWVRLVLALGLVLASIALAGNAAAAAVTGTVKLDPATAQVNNGDTFAIKVVATTTVATSGVSATITFNKSVVQVVNVARAAAWANAPFFLAGDQKAIDAANRNGALKNVGVSYIPPTSVPAGAQEFITVTFKAIACGTVNMTVPISGNDATLLDGRSKTYGGALKLQTSGATVTVCQGGGASGSPGASGSATPSDSGALPSASIDPNASPSAQPSASDGAQPSGSVAPGPGSSGGPASSGDTAGGSGLAASTSEQSGWLTFATAALAIAAAGLAALILVLVVVAIAAATAGGVVLFRVWRRYAAKDKADEAARAAEGAPAAETTAAPPDADPAAPAKAPSASAQPVPASPVVGSAGASASASAAP